MDTDSKWKKIRTPGIKFKLALSYILVILISFGIAAYFLDKNLEENSLREIKSALIDQASLIAAQIPSGKINTEDTPFLQGMAKSLAEKIRGRITVVDAGGKVLADSEKTQEEVLKMENHAARPEIKAALDGYPGEEIRYSSTLKIDMLYAALPLEDSGKIIGAVRLSVPLTRIQSELEMVRKTIFMGLLFALGLALMLGSFFVANITGPISGIIYGARRFSQGDFSHKIMLGPKDEIGELAIVLNTMAHDIEGKIKQVEVQNQHLGAILHSMVESIIIVDKDSRIVSVNAPAERIFSIKRHDVENKLFLEVIPNNDIADLISDILKKEQFISKEFSLVWPVRKIFRIDASPVFEGSEISGCLIVIHDITEARRVDAMRRDFIANVSHELKTPLTSIKGFVETLLEGALDDKENARHFLSIIKDHAERLDNLVNDLLSLSYLESKEISLKKEATGVRYLLDDILASFKSQLKKKSVEAKNDLPPDLSVKADKDKLGQVFTNLIDNAVKFNREGGSVRVYSEEAGGDIKFVVEDTGVGIPGKDIPRIFERFYRVDKARSSEVGGTGLGLSIVKHIVELHGGTVGVESSDGAGSKFWLTLPRA